MSSTDHLLTAPGITSTMAASIRARLPQHVVYRSLVSETVVLNVQTGKYYGLNETAGRMLELLDRGLDAETIVAQLAKDFDAPAETVRHDFLALCVDLSEKGLIELEPVAPSEGQ